MRAQELGTRERVILSNKKKKKRKKAGKQSTGLFEIFLQH